jgi:aerobic carbon-monoxide dehydrogenase medium subunit
LKAPAFDYVRVRSLREALDLLAEHGAQAKIIAGGQSLVPALNLRLLAPARLIDIGALSDLNGVSVHGGSLRIGALTRHVELERSPVIAEQAPLLARAVRHVAHPAIRNRGTIGGNLAHADPASELPACALALGARIIVAGRTGERSIPAKEFFRGLYETALGPDEILTAIEFPARRADERSAFLELARRSGDYALVGLAAQGIVRAAIISELQLAYFAVGSVPQLAVAAATALSNQAVTEATLANAEAALADDLAPHDDLHASAATRLHLARVLMRRAVGELVPGSVVPELERRRA